MDIGKEEYESMERLFNTYVSKKNIYSSFVVEDINSKFARITAFIEKFKNDFEIEYFFFTKKFEKVLIKGKTLFMKLEIDEKIRLIDILNDGKRKTILLSSETDDFYILLALLGGDRITINQDIYLRHPYLTAVYGSDIEKVNCCLSEILLTSEDMISQRIRCFSRYLAGVYDEEKIKSEEIKLKEKCFISLNRTTTKIQTLQKGDYFKNGTHL